MLLTLKLNLQLVIKALNDAYELLKLANLVLPLEVDILQRPLILPQELHLLLQLL